MIFKIESLAQSKILSLLTTLDIDLALRLAQKVDLNTYCLKLSKCAKFVIAEVEWNIVGIIAFYQNDEGKELYVPYVCISNLYRKRGIASTLLHKLFEYADKIEYNVSLEVLSINNAAIALYKKAGFEVCEERQNKLYMKRYVKR